MKIYPIFPSILSTNFFNLEKKLKQFVKCGIHFIHLDIMDGHFVDNLSFGPSTLAAIKSRFPFSIDSHLMVSNPNKMIKKFLEKGSDWISFHIETIESIEENISLIKDKQKKVGLVLNPDTAIEKVFLYLKKIDYVLLMSVFPGYGGQSFIDETINRTSKLKKKIKELNLNCLIQVDGGINPDIIMQLKDAGADLFVIGTSLYGSKNIRKEIKKYDRIIKGVIK